MSFINNISCYFILEKITNNIGQQIDISGSFNLSYIKNNFDSTFKQSPNTIISNINGFTTKFIVGIPNNNINNLSKKDIMNAIKNYNINLLRNIRPYIKLAGNDTTVPDIASNCISAEERKALVLKYKNLGNINELNKKEIRGIVEKLGLSNRICLGATNY